MSSPDTVDPSGNTTTARKRKHRPGLQRVQIACERCRSRKNKVSKLSWRLKPQIAQSDLQKV
jgi:hypothetical protein